MTYYISNEEEVSRYPESCHALFYQNLVKDGIWTSAAGVDLYYASAIKSGAKACVVISPGRAEAAVKYAELMYELYQNGYSVFVFDHQGQGKSSRLAENPQIGFVSSFNDYVSDFKTLIDKVLNPLLKAAEQSELDKYLLAHSMGGAIGSLFLLEHPSVFTKAVLSAPMIGIKVPLPETLINAIVSAVLTVRRAFNLPERYFLGQGDYQAYPFYKNRLTSCEKRYEVFRKVMAQDPSVQLGGIGFTWIAQAIIAMRAIRRKSHAMLLPILVFKAQADKIVDNDKIEALANDIPTARMITVPDAEHEILFETDEIRTPVIQSILTFFDGDNQINN